MAFALGIVMALALMLLDRLVFAPISSVAELIHNAETCIARPSASQGFLASFYGALDEEILMRTVLASLGFSHSGQEARAESGISTVDRRSACRQGRYTKRD
jgi:hypothetical protein